MTTDLVETSQQQRPNELRALSRLAFDELSKFPGGIWQMHQGIARRAFWGVGVAGRPVKVIHDAVSRIVYGALGTGVSLLGQAADRVMEQRRIGEDLLLSSTRRGSAIVAAITGLIGDRLEQDGSELHEAAAVRVDGHPVPLNPASVATAFPAATGRPVVFLHGLMGTEFLWSIGAGESGENYGTRLARDLGCTPVYVRYNSGRHISENGRSVADLLEALFGSWPVDVEQVVLVGHSMGGLVARSACYLGAEDGQAWTEKVRHVVSLGTPHMGAPLEQAVHWTSAGLSALPETRMFGSFLRRRSAGIRDLRQGSLVDEDWRDRDPDALRAAAYKEIPLLKGATHCFVSASVTRSDRHPIARIVGDYLVLVPSASGRSRTRRIPFKAEHGAHVGSTHHIALLNHPVVYERLRHWLSTPPAVLAAASG
jgi:pimeloyl-ACP methyl ester carboxylesterase